MARKGESIYKRTDGRWEARYIHHYENGKAKYKYIYGTSYADVKQKRLEAFRSPQSYSIHTSINVERLAKQWLEDTRFTVKESTYTRYHRHIIKYIIPGLKEFSLNQINARMINKFSDSLINSFCLSSKTVTDIICILKAVFKYASLNGYPCPDIKGVRYPQKTAADIKIIPEQSVKALEELLLSHSDTTSFGILLSLCTGIRIGELCGLMWGDIDFSTCTLHICRTVERIPDLHKGSCAKTKVIISSPKTESSQRHIPLPHFLAEHLKQHSASPDCYIVTGKPKFTEPHCFYVRYKRFLKRHCIPDNTFHALRHTFATRCVECGFDTKSLSEILGHANVSTTMTFYVHPSMESKRRQMERLSPQYY